MKNSIIRCAVASAIGGAVALACGGCVVYSQPAYQPVVYQPAYQPAPAPVVVAGPVIEAPGVVLIDVEPPPYQRVYVYDPGYPPGCYFYGGYYWYGGYRYPHDVFINRYVTVNVRENRYVNVEENRERGRVIEEQHRTEYVRTGGHPVAPGAAHPNKQLPPGAPAPRPEERRKPDDHKPN